MKKLIMPSAEEALPGRDQEISISDSHFVNGHSIRAHVPSGLDKAVFGMGCFWGAERLFWQQEGVYATAVGYTGGFTPNPSYQEVCSGMTGHNEVVLVIYDPAVISYEDLLRLFWESHDPTQGMRQGNDTGTQYRSGIYATSEQQYDRAIESKKSFQLALSENRIGQITTEIRHLDKFYYAEEYHQQYLAKNPAGYCGLRGTGTKLPTINTYN